MTSATTSRFNPWPLAIIAYFVFFISLTIAGVAWLSHQKMDLVRGDYYDDEIRYQEQLDRIDRTQPFKGRFSVDYNSPEKLILISLPAEHGGAQSSGRIRLYRPSDEKMDQEIQLALDTNGTQRLEAKNLKSGLWKVRVYWTVQGHDYYFTRSMVIGTSKS